ncbi:F0F1 ATP synthase subunit epsilon [Alkalicaulis satelles]|uniref:ATP synthase epsilon chain n=1 Tax=Alkalicaulis satelles TaxID=2609175 RepID=A0A5M6ZC82_9PROT|nr:F0F1 ATP synthase subunit epsilon [Alkalicaulis satelles]KAA5802329.1 F0F1 ATP synthase subunit epsilon [Alkalicaulis satelles]
MADKLHFDLVSPEKRVFAGEVDMVVVPGEDGDFGVLAGHAPFMSTIRSGAIAVHEGGSVTRTFIHGGFAEVTPDGLTILAEEAIALDSVNAESVSAELTKARETLSMARDDAERAEAEARVDKLEALLAALAH